MKYLGIVSLAGLAALATAQNGLSEEQRCTVDCGDDICCIAECNHVPCPSDDMANNNTECFAQCDQGEGTEQDIAEYSACTQRCIDTVFMPGDGNNGGNGGNGGNGHDGDHGDNGTPTQTSGGDGPTGTDGPAPTGTDSGNGGNGGDGSGDDSGDGSEGSEDPTGTSGGDGAPEPTNSEDAAPQLSISAVSIFGLMLAAFAL